MPNATCGTVCPACSTGPCNVRTEVPVGICCLVLDCQKLVAVANKYGSCRDRPWLYREGNDQVRFEAGIHALAPDAN